MIAVTVRSQHSLHSTNMCFCLPSTSNNFGIHAYTVHHLDPTIWILFNAFWKYISLSASLGANFEWTFVTCPVFENACKNGYFFQRGTQNRQATRFENPEDYINELNLVHEMGASKVLGCVSSLRVDLTNQPLNWVKQFGIHGLKALLGVLAHCYSKKM